MVESIMAKDEARAWCKRSGDCSMHVNLRQLLQTKIKIFGVFTRAEAQDFSCTRGTGSIGFWLGQSLVEQWARLG